MKPYLARIVLATILASLAASPTAAEEPTINWQCEAGVTTSQVLDVRDMLIKDIDCTAKTIQPNPAFGPGDVARTCVSPNNIGDVLGFCVWNSVRTFVTYALGSVRAIFVGQFTWDICGTGTGGAPWEPECMSVTYGDYLTATVLIIPISGAGFGNPACVSQNSMSLQEHPALFTQALTMDTAAPVCSG